MAQPKTLDQVKSRVFRKMEPYIKDKVFSDNPVEDQIKKLENDLAKSTTFTELANMMEFEWDAIDVFHVNSLFGFDVELAVDAKENYPMGEVEESWEEYLARVDMKLEQDDALQGDGTFMGALDL